MTTPSTATPSSKVTLVDLAENDLPELSAFVAAQSGRDTDETLRHLKWLLLDNPARQERTPLGWGVRSSTGTLAGCILYLPQMFVLNGKPLLLLGSSCFYVDESHRGSGGSLFLKFTRAAKDTPLFGNSANAIAAQLWKARGATPIADSDHELLGILHWPPVIEEVAHRRGVPPTLSKMLAAGVAPLCRFRRLKLPRAAKAELNRLSTIDEVMELRLVQPTEGLTALRHEPFLRWRYFSGTDPSVSLFAFRTHDSKKRFFVAVNERPRGYRGQIRAIFLLDVFPKPQPDTLLAIVAALHERYRNDVHMIVLRCLDGPSQEVCVHAGFQRRAFESPNGWLLDRQRILPTHDFHFVPADGDWVI
jgi:hypothetical protein